MKYKWLPELPEFCGLVFQNVHYKGYIIQNVHHEENYLFHASVNLLIHILL